MRRSRAALTLIALTFTALTAATVAESAQPRPASPVRFAMLDAKVDGAAAAGLAGQVLVTNVHGLIYARAVDAPGRPHRRGELWRWASVTKQLTATLVMQEVAAGRLSLDDTLARRLPAFHGPRADQITLRGLLQHMSGLPNPNDTPTVGPDAVPSFYLRTDAQAGRNADALGFCAGPPPGPPGPGFTYNNCDFIVLGAVLEGETGRAFADLLQDRIARPLGLRTLAMAAADRPAPGLVKGVKPDGSPEADFVLATFGAAGAAYGAPEDLAAFDRALMDGRLLPEAARRVAWTGDPKLGYEALGVWSFPATLKGCAAPVALIERRGEIGGVEVRNLIAPDLGRALIVFADRADLDFGEIWQGKGLSYDLADAAFCGGLS